MGLIIITHIRGDLKTVIFGGLLKTGWRGSGEIPKKIHFFSVFFDDDIDLSRGFLNIGKFFYETKI